MERGLAQLLYGPGHLTVSDHLPIGRGQAENPLHPLPLLRLGEEIGGGGVPPGLEDFGQYGRVGTAQFFQVLQPAP